MLSMQISMMSLKLLQRSGQCFFAKGSKRASELKPREEALMQSGPAHVKDIMKGRTCFC